jgi:RNA polymerase sigma factor (sigma-70 family)
VGVDETGIAGRRDFPATHWSAIRHARDPESPEHRRHLQALVEIYWKPVYAVVRQAFGRGQADAKDLTQEFFAEVVLARALPSGFDPDRGSFRVFLRTALARFMSNEARYAGRLKRGGGERPIALDGVDDEALAAPPEGAGLAPDEAFDRAWNRAVMERAVAELERRLVADGKAGAFAIWKRYDLEGGSAELSYGELGRSFGLSAAQVKNALVHARGVFRDAVTDVVRGYVDGPEDLAEELRHLFLR